MTDTVISMAEQILDGIKAHLCLDENERPDPEAAIVSLGIEGGDWIDLLSSIDESTSDVLDVDEEEWDDLGGNPSITTPVGPELTVAEVVAFLDAAPRMSVQRVVLKVIGKRIAVDTDSVPHSYQFTDAAVWMELRIALNQVLKTHHDLEIESDPWKNLGRDRVPSVSDIIELAEEMYMT